MKVPLSQLASLTDGVVVGDADCLIEKSAPLHTADSVSITFVADKPEKLDWNVATSARAVVLNRDHSANVPERFAQLLVDDPKKAFEQIVAFFHPKTETLAPGVSPKASVAPTAKIGQNVSIDDFAVIGENVELADGVRVYPGVVLMTNVVVGANTTIFPNVVVYENCLVRHGSFLRV